MNRFYWGKDDERIAYLSAKCMMVFAIGIYKTADDSKISLIEKQIKSNRKSVFLTRSYHFGTIYSATFMFSINSCMVFDLLLFRLLDIISFND